MLCVDSQKNKSKIEICDDLTIKSVAVMNETITKTESLNKCFTKRVNEFLVFPKFLDFSHDNVSIECRKASQEFLNSLDNFELWALESKK